MRHGTVDNVEKFFEQFGWESFEFKGGEIYHNAWIGGLFVAVGLTGFAVLLATLFNLITDLVGGIRVSVLEEEVVAKPRSSTTVSSVSTYRPPPTPRAVWPVRDPASGRVSDPSTRRRIRWSFSVECLCRRPIAWPIATAGL